MEIKETLIKFIEWQRKEGCMTNESLSPEYIANEFLKFVSNKKKSVAIIASDSKDFIEWSEKKFEKFKPLMQKKFIIGDTTYFCVTRPSDLCGNVFNEIMETDNTQQNKYYEEIKNQIPLCLKTNHL